MGLCAGMSEKAKTESGSRHDFAVRRPALLLLEGRTEANWGGQKHKRLSGWRIGSSS